MLIFLGAVKSSQTKRNSKKLVATAMCGVARKMPWRDTEKKGNEKLFSLLKKLPPSCAGTGDFAHDFYLVYISTFALESAKRKDRDSKLQYNTLVGGL